MIEVLANLLTFVSVLLTVHLKKSLYPVGILSTVLFLFVFWNAKLYASAGLQVYFTLIQLYGWWFWTKGAGGGEPPIGNWGWDIIALLGMVAAVLTGGVSFMLHHFTDAQAPVFDTAILALSVLAQFLLDRKQMKNWIVWGVVDALSIYVYGSQKLWLTATLYTVLLVNVFYGWGVWRNAKKSQIDPVAALP